MPWKNEKYFEWQEDSIVFGSHNMQAGETLCNKCILIEKGKLIFSGNSEECIKKYIETNSVTSITKNKS